MFVKPVLLLEQVLLRPLPEAQPGTLALESSLQDAVYGLVRGGLHRQEPGVNQ